MPRAARELLNIMAIHDRVADRDQERFLAGTGRYPGVREVLDRR